MRNHPPALAYLALTAVCVLWGTVYLGIRIALESFPPLPLMGIRFFLPGLAILLVAAAMKARIPTGRELLLTALYGVITLGLGIGTLFFAVQSIPSGMAAMFVTTSPFWLVGVESLLPGGDRLNLPTIGGMLIGLAGTLLLAAPDAIKEGFHGPVFLSFFVLQLGCAGWAVGAVLQRRHATTAGPLVNGGVQELATGIAFLLPALLLRHDPIHWNWKGAAALAYLVLVGGVITYTAYLYAMKHLPVSLVSIHNYVNPMIAVILGALIYGEKFELRYLVSMALIFAGVLMVKRYSAHAGAEMDRVNRVEASVNS